MDNSTKKPYNVTNREALPLIMLKNCMKSFRLLPKVRNFAR